MAPKFNILMYSHDTYGLGHIRRTLAIAQRLIQPETHILIITGSPLTGRFNFPDGVDYVRIPGMIKKENGIYQPSAIRLAPDQVINIRRQLILSTIMAFEPDLFIVDKEPLGLKKEVLPGLEWIRANRPHCRTVLGLRDIMDEACVVRTHWKEKKVIPALENLYSEIWVYGNRKLYDPIVEYQIPPQIIPKIFFTGYLPRPLAKTLDVQALGKQFSPRHKNLVLVTTGGGKDGYRLLDTFFTWCEQQGGSQIGFDSLVVLGPFLPKQDQDRLGKRATRLDIQTRVFYGAMDALVGACDLMICMGGYNTLCEALSNQTPALVVPREYPRKEQLIRARTMAKNKLVEYIPEKALSPDRLGQKISKMLACKDKYKQKMTEFDMGGMDAIKTRVQKFQTPIGSKQKIKFQKIKDPQGEQS